MHAHYIIMSILYDRGPQVNRSADMICVIHGFAPVIAHTSGSSLQEYLFRANISLGPERIGRGSQKCNRGNANLGRERIWKRHVGVWSF